MPEEKTYTLADEQIVVVRAGNASNQITSRKSTAAMEAPHADVDGGGGDAGGDSSGDSGDSNYMDTRY